MFNHFCNLNRQPLGIKYFNYVASFEALKRDRNISLKINIVGFIGNNKPSIRDLLVTFSAPHNCTFILEVLVSGNLPTLQKSGEPSVLDYVSPINRELRELNCLKKYERRNEDQAGRILWSISEIIMMLLASAIIFHR